MTTPSKPSEVSAREAAHAYFSAHAGIAFNEEILALLLESREKAAAQKAQSETIAMCKTVCACEVSGADPCGENCSCAWPHLSGGCLRCATHGSHEQQRAAADRIANTEKAAEQRGREDAAEEIRQLREVVAMKERDQPMWYRLEASARLLIEGHEAHAAKAAREDERKACLAIVNGEDGEGDGPETRNWIKAAILARGR